ncbi:MAG: hypothetical protein EU547_01560 [Promethearchaeota archaeon]|nr:MAG: hypothetical protein EU547_01560 [Candidatus Lokiarchaeota archaeon]
MELMNLCWDETNQGNLLFKFGINEEERQEINRDTVKSMNLKFELAKRHERAHQIIQEPFLISIKQFHFSANILVFSVELDKLTGLDDLQINIIRLTIFYYSGIKDEIFINQTFQLSEISYDDGQIVEYMEEEVIYEQKTSTKVSKKVTRTRVSKNAPSRSKSKEKKSHSSSIIPSPSRTPHRKVQIPLSKHEYEQWMELKGDRTWDTTLYMVREKYHKLKEIEKELKQANNALRKIALNKSTAASSPVYLSPPPGESNATQLPSPPVNSNTPNSTPPSINRNHSLENPNAEKVLQEKKDARTMQEQIEVMREMKEKFEKVKDIKELLSKVPDEDLKKPRAKTDHMAFLEFKQKSHQKVRAKKIKTLQKLGCEEEIKELALEELDEKIQLLLAQEKKQKSKR